MLRIIGAIIDFITLLLKRSDKKKTPHAKSKQEIARMDDAIARGDSDDVAGGFDELLEDANRFDRGQHETGKDDRGQMEK